MMDNIHKYFLVTETGAICGCTVHFAEMIELLLEQFDDFCKMRNHNGGFIQISVESLGGKVFYKCTSAYSTKEKVKQEMENLINH